MRYLFLCLLLVGAGCSQKNTPTESPRYIMKQDKFDKNIVCVCERFCNNSGFRNICFSVEDKSVEDMQKIRDNVVHQWERSDEEAKSIERSVDEVNSREVKKQTFEENCIVKGGKFVKGLGEQVSNGVKYHSRDSCNMLSNGGITITPSYE